MNAVRILNLNIWNYNKPWPVRRDLIIDLILDSEPDAVALQEIRYRDWTIDPRHQGDQILAGLPGYASVWQPAHYWPPEHRDNIGEQQWEGLAILSRHPIVDQAVLRLSRAPDDPRDGFQRLVLGAQVRTPAGPFWLFDTHYPLSAQARARAAVETYRFVTERAGATPFALTGDLNAEPEDLPVRYLVGSADIDGYYGDLIDAWTACHPDRHGHTFSAWRPRKRIDYVLVPPHVTVREIAVVGSVPDESTVSPSDHCALLADLEIGSTPASDIPSH
jgi:endonuclease/exonuclease/phosphatase family metal-dependent hydrolase